MIPVPAFENMMLKIGPLRPIAAWVFDRAPDLPELLAGLAAASGRIAPLRLRLTRRFGWHFWVPAEGSPGELLRQAVTLVDDPAFRAFDDLGRLLQQLDAMPFPADRPPWRALIVNSGGAGLPALVIQCDHAIADGIRIERIARHFGDWLDDDPEARALAGAVAANPVRRALADIVAPADGRVAKELGMVLTVVPARLLRMARKSGTATTAIIGAMADALAMSGTLAPGSIRSGVAMEMIGERRPGTHAGTFVAAKAVAAQPASGLPAPGRSWLFHLLARTGPWRFPVAALFPAMLARAITTAFYRRFDMVVAITPSTRLGPEIGGARTTRIFGVGPMLADTHVSVTGVWSNGDCGLTIRPGPAIAIAPSELADRFRTALEARAGEGAGQAGNAA